MKLHLEGLEIRTEAGNPIGPRFFVGGKPPTIGFGQYGIAELRVRACEKEKHDTLFFSATKWRHLTQLADRFRIPFFLVVRWTNGQGYFLWRGQRFGKTFGGRSRMNMRDSYDQEELIQIPITEFHLFYNK